MANAQLKFRKISFEIEDDLTHCVLLWDSTDPVLCGYGARRSFPKEITVAKILDTVNAGVLVDPKWSILR